jgi:hypothetical protein
VELLGNDAYWHPLWGTSISTLRSSPLLAATARTLFNAAASGVGVRKKSQNPSPLPFRLPPRVGHVQVPGVLPCLVGGPPVMMAHS